MMFKKHRTLLLSLPAQGVILLIGIILLTAGAIGIPAVWLINDQLHRHAWEQVNQGSEMLKVLLDVRNQELRYLVTLTAQRPTLSELLTLNDPVKLTSYLETIRVGANLDLVMICDNQEEEMYVWVGSEAPELVCHTASANTFYQSPAYHQVPGWLLAFQPVLENTAYDVVVGQALDEEFSRQLSEQVLMENLLIANQELVTGSFADNLRIWETISNQVKASMPIEDDRLPEKFSLDDADYYTVRSTYGETDLETIVLLPGTAIAETQQQLTRSAASAILIVTLFCSLIAVLLIRRVSRPLERLRDSAIALRMGDLVSPVSTHTKVREIAEVTYALEDARIALRHSLGELRQEKAWRDYLLESVVEGIITIDRQSRITFFSKGAERITCRRQEQVLGKTIDEVLLLTDRELSFSQCIPPPGKEAVIVTILVNDRPLTLAVSGVQLAPPEAGKASLAVSIRDISNEEAMRGLLGDFLANITHEFRTPLTALAVSIELLLDRLPELTMAEIHELLVSNRLGVLSLQSLIDNLLEGASIEAGRFHVSPRLAELSDIIQEVARIMQPLMEKNKRQLMIELPVDIPLVLADPRRTSQVLVNLLSNAIKWGPQGSEILLSVKSLETEVKVSIADRGPGINPEQKLKLFTRFGHMQSNEGRAEYGAGLGLSVVKAIVESQKGQVGVEDRHGGGAIFWFTIPVADLHSDDTDED
jgi:PAS domain S-box-containing protein